MLPLGSKCPLQQILAARSQSRSTEGSGSGGLTPSNSSQQASTTQSVQQQQQQQQSTQQQQGQTMAPMGQLGG
uniref:Uncharacterized protein n=1 Tax=Parascaris equorum TaxID=6256 RepID=A0A914S489_PAREQ